MIEAGERQLVDLTQAWKGRQSVLEEASRTLEAMAEAQAGGNQA